MSRQYFGKRNGMAQADTNRKRIIPGRIMEEQMQDSIN